MKLAKNHEGRTSMEMLFIGSVAVIVIALLIIIPGQKMAATGLLTGTGSFIATAAMACGFIGTLAIAGLAIAAIPEDKLRQKQKVLNESPEIRKEIADLLTEIIGIIPSGNKDAVLSRPHARRAIEDLDRAVIPDRFMRDLKIFAKSYTPDKEIAAALKNLDNAIKSIETPKRPMGGKIVTGALTTIGVCIPLAVGTGIAFLCTIFLRSEQKPKLENKKPKSAEVGKHVFVDTADMLRVDWVEQHRPNGPKTQLDLNEIKPNTTSRAA